MEPIYFVYQVFGVGMGRWGSPIWPTVRVRTISSECIMPSFTWAYKGATQPGLVIIDDGLWCSHLWCCKKCEGKNFLLCRYLCAPLKPLFPTKTHQSIILLLSVWKRSGPRAFIFALFVRPVEVIKNQHTIWCMFNGEFAEDWILSLLRL